MDVAIVSGADSGFFEHLFEWVRSIRDKPQGRGVSLCIFDMGLSDQHKDWLLVQGAAIRQVQWRYQCNLSATDRLLVTRPEIPEYFPGHDIYVWIDADAWVQCWDAVEAFCTGAVERGFCLAPELHPSYSLTSYWGIEFTKAWYGPPPANIREIPFNAGVFAGRADAPHWKAWLKRVADVVERPSFHPLAHFALDQSALNAVVNRDRLPCAITSERNNFLCNHGIPRISEDASLLLDPSVPYQPLGIVHNAGKDKKRLALLNTPSGGRLTRGFTYLARSLLPRGDYVSPGFAVTVLDQCFPNMVKGDPNLTTWPHLRRGINHNWYVDTRDPKTGFINRDETHILYNTALRFRDKQVLEIGCHMGWSACHLAAAGIHVDIIDPTLGKPEILQSVRQSLQWSTPANPVRLFLGVSPDAVEQLAREGKRWSLFFIDGNHEHPGPLQDAMVCEKYAERDAMMLFHDLAYLRNQGWKTRVYQTAQIMAAAWRGSVHPVDHQPDPTIVWPIPNHLRQFL